MEYNATIAMYTLQSTIREKYHFRNIFVLSLLKHGHIGWTLLFRDGCVCRVIFTKEETNETMEHKYLSGELKNELGNKPEMLKVHFQSTLR